MADIYDLDYNAIADLPGFKEKSALNIKTAIDKSKQNPIYRLLHSLSVHHLGRKASKVIAEHIGHVLDLQNWTLEQLTDIKDIGPVVAENVISYFQDPVNIEELQRMESLGVNLTQLDADKPLQVAEDAVLSGQTILFTGTLTQMGRKEAQSIAANAGAKNISAVSSNLNILVAGEKAGSKLKKAVALGTVKVMTEQEFLDLVRS
jgi:DNA ligase (NAD+)